MHQKSYSQGSKLQRMMSDKLNLVYFGFPILNLLITANPVNETTKIFERICCGNSFVIHTIIVLENRLNLEDKFSPVERLLSMIFA